MAKIIVKIDIHNIDTKDLKVHLERYRDDWFPLEDKRLISVDEAYLKVDPTEDSYRVFEFVGVEEDS